MPRSPLRGPLSLQSNSIRDITSARVSVPSYVVPAPDGTEPGPQAKQVWRTDLLATEPYWEGRHQRFKNSICQLNSGQNGGAA
jgi:protein phosphatase methylesterase 1